LKTSDVVEDCKFEDKDQNKDKELRLKDKDKDLKSEDKTCKLVLELKAFPRIAYLLI